MLLCKKCKSSTKKIYKSYTKKLQVIYQINVKFDKTKVLLTNNGNHSNCNQVIDAKNASQRSKKKNVSYRTKKYKSSTKQMQIINQKNCKSSIKECMKLTKKVNHRPENASHRPKIQVIY